MTQTIDAHTATAMSPQARVDAWLADFEAALATRDVERAVAMFAVDSFWRDLISFTWNIKTLEGREGIADMLTERAAATDAIGFRTRETPTDDGGGVVSAWIEFETAVGRGVGHLRLKDDEGVDAADRAAGAEGPRGAQGRVTGDRRGARQRSRHAVLGGEAGGRAGGTRLHDTAVHAGRRRRAGRHRARGPAASARCACHRRRPPRTTR